MWNNLCGSFFLIQWELRLTLILTLVKVYGVLYEWFAIRYRMLLSWRQEVILFVFFFSKHGSPKILLLFVRGGRLPNQKRINFLNFFFRQKLTVCPIIDGEEHLRLLNFQHNFITRIQNISNLQRLIFLDLYDNQIEEISGLSTLRSLRVLLLGKNR